MAEGSEIISAASGLAARLIVLGGGRILESIGNTTAYDNIHDVVTENHACKNWKKCCDNSAKKEHTVSNAEVPMDYLAIVRITIQCS
jgi:hypothetical protein